jgi:hypothetical protein
VDTLEELNILLDEYFNSTAIFVKKLEASSQSLDYILIFH